MSEPGRPGEWVLLCYRVPRVPSTPRIAVWRTLKRLGVAQIGDGVVALPADARTREQLEWVAGDIEQAGGSALLWTASPSSAVQERQVAAEMAAARAAEYSKVIADAAAVTEAGVGEDGRSSVAAVRRLRSELRRIERRDFFPPPERERARAVVAALAVSSGEEAPV